MRAVSPATVHVLKNILSKWECNAELRNISLKCFAKMAIVLHRSSPVERQIELLTICQLYLDVIFALLKTEQFLTRPLDEKFDIFHNEENHIDLNALTAVIDNIECMLSESQSRTQICNAICEANFISALAIIPKQVKQWEIDTQKLAATVVKAIVFLSRDSSQTNLVNSSNISNLFAGIKSLGKPSKLLIEKCIDLAYDEKKNEIILGKVITHLLVWIKDMNENEQIFVTETMLRICVRNLSW